MHLAQGEIVPPVRYHLQISPVQYHEISPAGATPGGIAHTDHPQTPLLPLFSMATQYRYMKVQLAMIDDR